MNPCIYYEYMRDGIDMCNMPGGGYCHYKGNCKKCKLAIERIDEVGFTMNCAEMPRVDRENYCCHLRNGGQPSKRCECKDHPSSYSICPFEDGLQAKGLCKFYNVSKIVRNGVSYEITLNNRCIQFEFTRNDILKLKELLETFTGD